MSTCAECDGTGTKVQPGRGLMFGRCPYCAPTIARGLLLVRPIETEETIGGGRIIVPQDVQQRMAAQQCEVVARGEDAVCDDEDCERQHSMYAEHQCPVRVGDWLLVRARCYVAGPEPERNEWFISQDDVYAILRTESA